MWPRGHAGRLEPAERQGAEASLQVTSYDGGTLDQARLVEVVGRLVRVARDVAPQRAAASCR